MTTDRYKKHDLATMAQVLARLEEAGDLLDRAVVGIDDVPHDILIVNDESVAMIMGTVVVNLGRAIFVLKGAIDVR